MKRIVVILALLLLVFVAKGQLAADITAVSFEGCSPQNITFGCTVSGSSGAVSYHWLSGNGDESSLASPTFSYLRGGHYTVSVVVTAGGQTAEASHEVVIFNSPVAAFDETPITGCIPLDVTMIDRSEQGDAPITDWLWYFGDGANAIGQNPVHSYEHSGLLTVSLRVTDANGCSDEHFAQIINVSSAPSVQVSAENARWCTAPLTANLLAAVTTAPNVSSSHTVQWDFGDGSSGTGDNVMHTYLSNGHYDVGVTVTDSYGCTTVLQNPDLVSIAPIEPRFEAPRTVCKKVSYEYKNLLREVECAWDFGDGTPVSYENNAHHVYMEAGRYTVTFTVDPNGPCRQSVTFEVWVQAVEASFTVDSTFSCNFPFVVNFTNTSIGDDSGYRYDFDYMGSIGSAENPSFTYIRNGVYHPTMIAYTSAGCTSTFEGPTIIVNHPEAHITSDVCGDCAPALITFNHDVAYTSNSSIVDFFWDYGDGTSGHSTSPSSSHVYSEVGEYVPSLTITDTSGCVVTEMLNSHLSSACHSIQVGREVESEDFGVMDFYHNFINGDTVCPQNLYYFYNSMYTASDTLVFQYVLQSENRTGGGNANNQYNEMNFELDTGWVRVGIKIKYLSCESDIYWWDRVYVKPPIMHFEQSTHCSAPFDFNYTITDNRGAQYWEWIVRNEEEDTIYYQPHSITRNFHYSYPGYGHYTCTLVGHNDNAGCFYVAVVNSQIDSLLFSWHIDPDTVCMNEYVSAEIDDYDPAFVDIAYDWESAGIPVDELDWVEIGQNISRDHIYSVGGSYTITAYLRQPDGCVTIYTKPVYVVDPRAEITPPSSVACLPASFEFQCSLPYTDDPIGGVSWNLGNNETVSGATVTGSYNEVGDYSISCHVTTRHGCTDRQVLENYIHVIDIPDLSVDFDDSVCIGGLSVFSSSVTDAEFTYDWNFGDGGIFDNGGPEVTHHYQSPGQFPLSLKVTGGIGCSDSVFYANGVRVESLDVDFSLAQSVFDCYPAEPDFDVSVVALPSGTEPAFSWQMGNGDVLYVENPDYLYNRPGTYNVLFTATTPAGCVVHNASNITVLGPYAEIFISDTAICVGDEVVFEMRNAYNVQSLQWVVGGGYNYLTPTVHHTYEYVSQSGYFPVSLTVYSGNCTIDIIEQIYVYQIESAFSLQVDGSVFEGGMCEPLDGVLVNNSTGYSDARWYLNGSELSISSDEVPVAWRNPTLNDSTVVVSLSVANHLGCLDSISHEYAIYHSPRIETSNDTTICQGREVKLSVWGGDSYYWHMPIGDSLQEQTVSPESSSSYVVDAYTERMCRATDSVSVQVIQPLDAMVSPEFSNISIGDTAVVVIEANGMPVVCRWSPDEGVESHNCDTLLFYPLENADYVVWLTDSLGCFEDNFNIHIDVDMRLTLDVPGAFTPLSGDDNSIVYVRGLGIKRLLQFRIFNRWGEEVFFTNDLHTGWDGTLNGKMQNVDTYSYYVEAEMFDGSIKNKKGTLMLIK